MATDVIANPATRFLTLVSDRSLDAITSVALRGDRLHARLYGGREMDLGKLAGSMRLEAGECDRCLLSQVGVDGVVSSRRVELFKSD